MDFGSEDQHARTHGDNDDFNRVEAFVHHPSEIPDVSGETSLTLALEIGKHTQYALFAEKVRASGSFKKLDLSERNCVMEGDPNGKIKLEKFKGHYRQECLQFSQVSHFHLWLKAQVNNRTMIERT